MPPSPGLPCPGAHSTQRRAPGLDPTAAPRTGAESRTHRTTSYAKAEPPLSKKHPRLFPAPLPPPHPQKKARAASSAPGLQNRPTDLPDKPSPSTTAGMTTPPASHERSQRINARLTSPRQPIWALTVPW